MFRFTIASTMFLMLCPAAHALVQSEESTPTNVEQSAPATDDATATEHHIEQIRRYEFTTGPVGSFSFEIVGDELRHAKQNGRVFPRHRLRYEPLDRMLQFIDETGTREFSVTLNNEAVESIHLGTWLQNDHNPLPRMAIGIYTDRLSPALASQLKLNPENTLIITGVVDNMPAAASGIQQYDIIVSIDSLPQVSDARLKRIVREKNEGETVNLRVVRKSQPLDLEVPVALAPNMATSSEMMFDLGGPGDRNIWLEEVNQAMANDPIFLDFPTTGDEQERVVIFSRGTIGKSAQPGLHLNSDSTNRPAGIYFPSDREREQLIARIERLEEELAILKAQYATNNSEKP